LIVSVLRKGFAGLLLDHLLIVVDDGRQILGREVGVQLGLDLVLARIEDVVELGHINIQRDLAEHLNKAAVRIVGEARIAGTLGQPFHGFVVQAQVENRVHHAGHGKPRAGTDAEQQRIRSIAQTLAQAVFELSKRGQSLIVDFLGDLVAVLKIDGADFG
jgi:hypothetical protein